MIKILVTGANGQLGQSIQAIKDNYIDIDFTFCNSKDLDITNTEEVKEFFSTNEFRYCINCAAYTNVEQAEKTPEKAYLVNGDGARNIAKECEKYNIYLFIYQQIMFLMEKKAHHMQYQIAQTLLMSMENLN